MAYYGFVYVLSNQIMPNIYKIGYTEKSPMQRASDLSNTSIPLPYEVICYGEIEDPMAFERQLHEDHKEKRVAGNREFFKLDYVDLMNLNYIIEEYCTNYVECEALNMIKYEHIKECEKDAKNED
jgi:hypothetical protein